MSEVKQRLLIALFILNLKIGDNGWSYVVPDSGNH